MKIEFSISIKPDFLDVSTGAPKDGLNIRNQISMFEDIDIVRCNNGLSATVLGSKESFEEVREKLGRYYAVFRPRPFVQSNSI